MSLTREEYENPDLIADLKARAEKLAEALRKALAELTHANSNAGTRAEVAVIAALALAEIGEEK